MVIAYELASYVGAAIIIAALWSAFGWMAVLVAPLDGSLLVLILAAAVYLAATESEAWGARPC